MNNIDKLFQDAFADAQMPVNDAVWNAIQSNKYGKSKGGGVNRRWVLVLLLLLVLGGISGYMMNKTGSAALPEVKIDLNKDASIPFANHATEASSETISFKERTNKDTKETIIAETRLPGVSTDVDNYYSQNKITKDLNVVPEDLQKDMNTEDMADMNSALTAERKLQDVMSIGSLQYRALTPIRSNKPDISPSMHDVILSINNMENNREEDMTLAEKVFEVASDNSGRLTGRLAKSSAVQDIFSLFGR